MCCSGNKLFILCRYDRDFLLQFMLVCKEIPDSLPPLDVLGLEPADQLSLTRRSRQLLASRQASIGGSAPAGTNLRSQHRNMGQFTSTSSSKFGPGAERFETGGGRSVSLGGAPAPFRNPACRTAATNSPTCSNGEI